jgi:hypothetical protein
MKDEALPFGVGGGLVAIKTLLSRDPCVHANTAIEMIDAILKEHPAAQPAPVQKAMPENWFAGMPEEYRKEAWRVATPPAQRQWVGLTDEEFDDLRDNNFGVSPLISAVEAKLKEKNAAAPEKGQP